MTAADIDPIRSALASGKASVEDRFHLRFALARVLGETGDFAAAFTEYGAANRDRLAALPPLGGVTTTERADRTIALFTPAFVAARHAAGDPSDAPIFILGMPRSGSTLLEQILSSHPQIEGTQELADVTLMARELDLAAGPQGGAYPDALAALSPDRLRALGAEYLARTQVKRKTARPFFLDKQPANWLHAGFIRLMLPNARSIDMRRDALGCCLSMFRQHFARGAVFTYSLEQLALEYRAYVRLTAHFDQVMPGAIKRVALADLVADLDGVVRDVLDYLGLPFAPECLRFFESDRAVFTPSSEQVRRPINDDSAGLLRSFEPHLGELKTLLGDLAD